MSRQIVFWGHVPGPGANTLSYVWAAMVKAFRHLGYSTVHVADDPESRAVANLATDTLLFVEGQQDQHVPIYPGIRYVLHNCDWEKYSEVRSACLALQVYSHDVLKREVEELEPFVYLQKVPGCRGILYQPWATDLLPDEIDLEDGLIDRMGSTESVWVGTIGGGRFGNINELAGWRQGCDGRGITFRHVTGATNEENRHLVRGAYLAPVIVGTWQRQNGYIPCRAFKNVSYGQPLLTNSKAVLDLFGSSAIWNEDTYALFQQGEACLTDPTSDEDIQEAMAFVRDHHTFVNRVQRILEVA